MSATLNVDMCMTGHSLGRNKLEHLLGSGTMTKAEIEENYAISRRIEAEERGLDTALAIFTSTQQARGWAVGVCGVCVGGGGAGASWVVVRGEKSAGGERSWPTPVHGCWLEQDTSCPLGLLRKVASPLSACPTVHRLSPCCCTSTPHMTPAVPPAFSPPRTLLQEIDEQWGLYDGFAPQLSRVLKYHRSHGRHMPTLKVIPPGLDFSNLKISMPEDPVLAEFEEQRRRLEQADILPPPSPIATAGSSKGGVGGGDGSPGVGPSTPAAAASTGGGAAAEVSVPSTPTADKQAAGGTATQSPRQAPAVTATVPRPIEGMLDPLHGPPIWQVGGVGRAPLPCAICCAVLGWALTC